MSQKLSIGKLSEQTGLHIETIRYYEKIGLLAKPYRSSGGHRLYNDAQKMRLHFISRCRKLGFTLDEVRSLLALVDGGDYTCREVQAITSSHLEDVQKKIADLKNLEQALADMGAQCASNISPACPVIEVLYRE
jgi:MerR family mercuric resistance operon transcriptional regulator